MSRGNGRMEIFVDDEDYRYFLTLLGETCEDYDVECWNYCGMKNHYHAVLVPRAPNISLAIQYLNGEYAKWWNRKHQRVGHTFQGRFKAQIVQREGYLETLMRYVSRNPVRAGFVDDPAKWRWNAYAALVGREEPPPFLTVDTALAIFGPADRETLGRRFANYVTSAIDDAAVVDRFRSRARVIGDKAFRQIFDDSRSTASEPVEPAPAGILEASDAAAV